MNDRQRAAMRVKTAHFPLIEATLFLDTHPNDTAALNYYRRMKANYDKAVADYNAMFGPLTAVAVSDDAKEWTWVKGPWPWEYEKEEA